MAAIRGFIVTMEVLNSDSKLIGERSSQILATSQDTTSRVEDVAWEADSVTHHIEAVANATYDMRLAIAEISENATKATSVATRAVELAAKRSGTVDVLSESANEIKGVIEAITSIAEQTNLLALNA
ncbi:methyl-accepting chemotaxis protein 4 [Acidithrix ferrooxidans]|uniref:Methyl-accepting chemotaxis protein 4 n=1 Tax=Acidithrix ferrooxidans TaxID=1280514 RepID=A0A0D8HHZ9_9ACTN|nr:methyl-accepting chemotaxis protein 4 [Acidithrix ferrooxidans]